jgi:lipoprotein-releasing system permease protein
VNVPWIVFVARRYFKAKRRDRGIASGLLSVTGIAVGVMALLSVLAVMNGFQMGFIEDILEVSSYHLRVSPAESAGSVEELADEVVGLGSVLSAVPFAESKTLILGSFRDPRACAVRGVPQDIMLRDRGFREQVEVVRGAFDIEDGDSIVLGDELARYLGVRVGETVSLLTVPTRPQLLMRPEERIFRVTGVFRTGYYDYDVGLGFVELSTMQGIFPQTPVRIGVKLRNRFRDRSARLVVEEALGGRAATVTSWREYNRAFFGALRMEKLLITVLLGLIFVVVGVNIYHSLRRSVYERIEEIGVLKATGASGGTLMGVFVVDGILIGGSGAVLGLVLGLLVAYNVNQVFAVAEALVNALLAVVQQVFAPFVAGEGGGFSLFSPMYFYLTEVPATVLFGETLLIFVFAVLSSVAAAYFASKHIVRIKPAQVLRYEQT